MDAGADSDRPAQNLQVALRSQAQLYLMVISMSDSVLVTGKRRAGDVVGGAEAPKCGPETCFLCREATIGTCWVGHRYAPRIAAWAICVFLSAAASAQTPQPTGSATQQPDSVTPSSPLAIHVGDADLLFGGFIDATSIRRDVNTGSGLGTSFGTIPFGNTVQGHMNDTQFSSQNSRLTLQATSKVGAANLKGVLEVDFLGNAPNGLNVTTNSNTLRMRVFWGQYRQGAFEFLTGQAWSLMTPNRNGLSPETGDVFFGQTVDPNYQAGLAWGRTMQFRLTTHPHDSVTAAVSIENPDQYVGSGVKLPAGLPSGEVDTGATVNDVPNAFPDIIGKAAFDPKIGHTHQHIDAALLVRNFKTYNLDTDTTFKKTAVGGALNAAVELIPSIRLVAAVFYSSGGGRYLANTNLPDFIVNHDASLTLVKTRSSLIGTEIQASHKTMVYGYYSAAHADRAVATDVDGSAIGFGVPGSTAANEQIVEATAGVTHTFFRDPKIGGMQFMAQYSHVRRTPFSVPPGTPADASVNMIYLNVRYFLP